MFYAILLLLVLCPVSWAAAPYATLFLSSPRPGGDTARSKIPDADNPMSFEPGTDLRLLPAGATTPAILVDTHNIGAVLTPLVSFDGQYLFYSFCPDLSPAGVNRFRDHLPYAGCDIYRKHLATGVITPITTQALWHPSEGITTWSTRPDRADPPGTAYLGYGIISSGPVELPNGDVFFTSNLNGFDIIKGFARPSTQGYIWHKDTETVEQVWFPPTMVLDPIILSQTGEIAFATLENSLPDAKPHRWAIWRSTPFGADWGPLFSATMEGPHTRHFHTEHQNRLCSTSYYITNNSGLGTIICRPLYFGTTPTQPEFGSPVARLNPKIPMGSQQIQWAYTPTGTVSLTPWAHTFDRAADEVSGKRVGKVGFPWAAPDGILVSYSPGPANYAMRPTNQPSPQLGIYLIPDGAVTDSPADLRLVYDDPQRNEFMARAVVPYRAIYGMDTPKAQPTRAPNDGTQHPLLPAGTPYGIVGSSSVWSRESCGGQWTPSWECAKPIYSIDDGGHSNRAWQGVDTYKFANADIAALRIIVQGGVSHLTYGPGASGYAYTSTFAAQAGNERLHVLGDVPLYKRDSNTGVTLMDPMGNPDTSWKARIPCAMSFGFSLVDSEGMALTQPGTWHQIACGQVQTNCLGCHVHFGPGLPWDQVAAGQPGYVPHDLTQVQLWTKEWYRDIKPIVDAKCVACHNPVQNAGKLDLQTAPKTYGLPFNWYVLAKDPHGELSGVPPISTYVGRASRYIAKMAAAESPLAWVVAGKRLDKVHNSARPTDEPPGNAASLPPGLHRSLVDIDLRPAVVTAHASVGLTPAEVQSIIHWIDIGTPVDIDVKRGWLVQEIKPVIAWGDTPAGLFLGLRAIGSSLNMASLQITRDGQPETATALGDGRWSLPNTAGRWTVSVRDAAGNSQTLTRLVGPRVPVPPPTVSHGEQAYTAYAISRNWINMVGQPMPTWANLSDEKKQMWEKVQ